MATTSNTGTETKPIMAMEGQIANGGAITWWELTGAIAAVKLSAAWAARGLDKKMEPELPSPDAALRAAMMARQEKHLLARQLGRGEWTLVREHVAPPPAPGTPKADPTYTVELRVTMGEDELTIEPADHPVAGTIRADWDRYQLQLSTEHISSWMAALIRKLKALPLRTSGGFYYIGPDYLEQWRLMASAITESSAHKIYEIPALDVGSAMDALLASLKREAEQEVAAIRKDLETLDLGVKALQTRATRSTAMIDKVTYYEQLLGASQADLQAKLGKLRADVGRALLLAQAEGEPGEQAAAQ